VKSLKLSKIPITDLGFAQSVKQYAPYLHRKLLTNKLIVPPSEVAKSLNLGDEKCFLAVRADVLDNQVIAFDKVYILSGLCENITEELLVKVDFFEKWIEFKKINVSYYSEAIEAIQADKEIAAILDTHLDSAILKSVETYYDTADKSFVVFESFYRGDMVKLTSTINYRNKANV
jgi:DNA-binding GntR family transcriptional regulator